MRTALAVLLLISALTVASSALAAPSRLCSGGAINEGNPNGIYLSGSRIRARDVSCPSARRIVRSYLRAKLNPNEVCAGEAESPPFPGCKVGRYLCRHSKMGRQDGKAPEECTWGHRVIRFLEYDEDNG